MVKISTQAALPPRATRPKDRTSGSVEWGDVEIEERDDWPLLPSPLLDSSSALLAWLVPLDTPALTTAAPAVKVTGDQRGTQNK